MQEIKQDHIIKEASSFSWISSIIIMSMTLLSIIGFYIYQYMSISNIENLQSKIVNLDNTIQSGSLDKQVIVANIIRNTSIIPPIDLKGIVENFHKTAKNSGLRLTGFSVHGDILTSNLIAKQENSEVDPVETIIEMMQTPDMIPFVLEPIYSLQGSSTERSTAVSFRILSPKSITNDK